MTPSTESTVKMLPLQRTGIDLDTMNDVTLVKDVPFTPVKTTQEALERLGHNAAKFLEVINDGLESVARAAAIADPEIPWMQEDEEGNKTAFTGTLADTKAVNGLVLTLAKTAFNYPKDKNAPVEQKRAAKDKAFAFIKANEELRNNLRENASA